MLSTIESINSVINNFIWGLPAMICIIGVGIVLSVKTRFIQIRKFPYAMKITIGRMLKKRKASDGALTPFQAVCTALAATVGTGNIAGVAGAIAIGGPGAVFWMWISAILGMCTKFSEVVLAVHFRETNNNGELVGGPMYYIKNGLKKHWHWLAYLFSALGVLTVFGTGNATQVNTITAALDSALINYNIISADSTHMINLIIGIIIMILIALIMIGGIKRIGRVTEKLIPFMAVLYIILAIGVVLVNINNVPAVFKSMADEMVEEIKRKNALGENTVFICPVGPVGQYPYFVDMVNEQNISLKNVWFINMDEYLTDDKEWIDKEDKLSFRGFMDRTVYTKIKPELVMPEEQRIFPDPKNLTHIQDMIKKLGGVDICFGGIGINGHVAFNEASDTMTPDEFLAQHTRVLEISKETRAVNSIGDLNGALDDMPHYCITIGINEIAHARKIRLGCFRDWHRSVVRHAAYGEKTAHFPVSLLQDHPDINIKFTEFVANLPE